ncbi:cobalt-precorrin-6X reductase [Rhodovulum sp. NI22]|nr:cobalt-precorrin-6X reductase [Rhodovulum sp. NI22]
MPRILVLGGTTEASALARALAKAGADAVFSYAGRTSAPLAQPLPTRVGGFGGIGGLVEFLREQGITRVVDATHPFAAQMSTHAVVACGQAGVPLCALERAPWKTGPGDRWTHVPDFAAAAQALPARPGRIFLAIGRQHLQAFAARPEHLYLLRLVDAPTGPLPLPRAEVAVSRGPFTLDGDRALMVRHGIDLVVAKNAGGSGARAKLDAARMLGLPVLLIDRPAVPDRPVAHEVAGVLRWLGHHADLGV